MWRAEVLTGWTGSGAEDDANRPRIGDAYALAKWQDVTGQPPANIAPDPNQYVVLVECEADVLADIEADGEYLVLWSEEVVEDAAQ